jgi:hypothetical protein
VGEENYRFFLTFLAVHVGMCWYGAILTCRLLWSEVLNESSDSAALQNLSFLQRFLELAFFKWRLTILMVFLFTCSFALTGFLGFHVYIVSLGMTTNEYYKWKEVSLKHKRDTNDYKQAMASNHPSNCKEKTDEEVAHAQAPIANPGQMPSNAYNLGMVANVNEVFYPRSLEQKTRKE